MRVRWLSLAPIGFLAVRILGNPHPGNTDFTLRLDIGSYETETEEAETYSLYEDVNKAPVPLPGPLPYVELGYETHYASLTRDCGNFYNFSNIPFAEPPLGNLRFEKAQPLRPINDPPANYGEKGAICPQIQVGWVPTAIDFLADYFSPIAGIRNHSEPVEPPDYKPIGRENVSAMVSEDCLTLDVMVPKRTWEGRETTKRPVLVWIFGGGFVFGSKILTGSPKGLFAASTLDPKNDFIYVSINYRLGAIGFLAGNNYEEDKGFENAGLSDQLVALQWVREHISKFGGDPDQVTVMGQSAGAASILHHITANGGEGEPPPFQRAILESPAFFPNVDRERMDNLYRDFKIIAKVSNLAELREVDTKELIWANALTTYNAYYGQFDYGPVVDNTYVPELTSELLRKGKFHQNISIMVGYNRQEGILFAPPWIRTKDVFEEYVLRFFPDFNKTSLDELLTEYYAIPEADWNEKHKVLQVAEALGDLAVDCNTYYLNQAKHGDVYAYKFNIFPGFHGQDTDYTFHPVETEAIPGLPFSYFQADVLQQRITAFVTTGKPTPRTWQEFDLYSKESKIYTYGKWDGLQFLDEVGMVEDPMDVSKCRFWQGVPYANITRDETGFEGSGRLVRQDEFGTSWDAELKV